MQKRKRILSSMLALSLMFSGSALAFAAGENDSGEKSLENVINAVKKRIVIPAAYTEFSQYSYESTQDDQTSLTWQLDWSDPQGKGRISVEADASGMARSYYHYEDRGKTSGLSDLTRAEGKVIAGDFLKKIWPECAAQMREISEFSAAEGLPTADSARVSASGASEMNAVYPSDNYFYTYRLYQNDLPVNFVTANVTVDKYSKKVVSFYQNGGDPAQYTFEDTSGLIGEDKASASYIQGIGINVEYFTYYDDKNQTMKAFAAYTLKDLMQRAAIDAKTGEVVKLYTNGYNGLLRSGGGTADAGSAIAAQNAALTKEEQAEVDTVAGLLSKAEAEKIARAMPGITSAMTVNYSSLQSLYSNKSQYIWSIGFDGGSVSLDAKTGEIREYYLYKERTDDKSKDLKADEAKKTAEAFLQKYASQKYGQSEYVYNPHYFDLKADGKGSTALIPIQPPYENNRYVFEYIRQTDGVNVNGNGLNISVDHATGEVSSYSLSWDESLNFPPVKIALTKEEAFQKLDDILDFSLCYALTDENTASLVYDFKTLEDIHLDPVTGTRLDWLGQPYKLEVPAYQDIDGHWAKDMILFLAQNGYYIQSEDGYFHPDQNIKQSDFFQYCYSPSMYSDREDLYNMLIREGVLTEDEANQSAQVTRQEAAKFTARMLGYDQLAQNGDIFKELSKDTVESSYKGYVAVALGLKIMNLDSEKSFNGTKPLTNAEAVAIVYNYLKAK